MDLVQGLLLASSSLVMLYIALFSWRQRQIPGALSLCLIVCVAIVWSVGAFFEINVYTIPDKIFWRNIQQIGVFGLPVMTLYFSICYTMRSHLIKYIHVTAVFAMISVLLIWTNDYHHLIRSGYVLVNSPLFGKNLTVELTPLGIIFLGYNFSLPLISIGALLNFSRNVAPKMRGQIYLIAFSMFLTILLAALKTYVFEKMGFYVQISVLYIPSALILFYSLFKYRFFQLSPIARDKVFEVIEQGILVMDKNGTVVDANSFARSFIRKHSGFTEAIHGQKLCDIYRIDPENCGSLDLRNEFTREIQVGSAENPVFIILKHYPLCGPENIAVGSVLIIDDITRHKLHERELERKAETDGLTSLLNRNGFKREFKDFIKSPLLNPILFSVLMMDLDYFKQINDSYGHSAGDRVLVCFGELLKATLKNGEIAARIGGEEFAVVLPKIRKTQAYSIAEQIRGLVENTRVTLDDGRIVQYTVSIGITESNGEKGKTLDQILHEADSALYDAKKKHRNCTIVYDDTLIITNS